jgi:hypothetical protein
MPLVSSVDYLGLLAEALSPPALRSAVPA